MEINLIIIFIFIIITFILSYIKSNNIDKQNETIKSRELIIGGLILRHDLQKGLKRNGTDFTDREAIVKMRKERDQTGTVPRYTWEEETTSQGLSPFIIGDFLIEKKDGKYIVTSDKENQEWILREIDIWKNYYKNLVNKLEIIDSDSDYYAKLDSQIKVPPIG